MAKIGERLVDDMIDRGRREVGAFFFTDSNIAQPTYPLRGGYEAAKDARGVDDPDRSLAERLEEPCRKGPDREERERDRGIDRE